MAYMEFCACIKTLQETVLRQELEIRRLRDQETALRLLVRDLSGRLNSASDPHRAPNNSSPVLSTDQRPRQELAQNGSASSNVSSRHSISSASADPRHANPLLSSPGLNRHPLHSQQPLPAGPSNTTPGNSAKSSPNSKRRAHPDVGGTGSSLPLATHSSSSPQPQRCQFKEAEVAPPTTTPLFIVGAPTAPANNGPTHSPSPTMSTQEPPKAMGQSSGPAFLDSTNDRNRRRTLLSTDMESTIEERTLRGIAHRYGDLDRANRAALTIQKAYYAHKIKKHYATMIKKGPIHMRRLTNAHMGVGRRLRKPSIMPNHKRSVLQGVPLQPIAAKGERDEGGRGGEYQTNLTRNETMAKMRERANLCREMKNSRRGQLIKAGTSMRVTASTEIMAEMGSGDLDSSAVKRGSLKGDERVIVGDLADVKAHTLRRPKSAGQLCTEGDSDPTNDQEKVIRVKHLLMHRCIGIHQFNRKPTTGIQYLVSTGLLDDDPLQVAKFLYEEAGLSKQRIGEFLGEIRVEFNMAVLDHMTSLIDMKNLPIDEALRVFQKMFLMPGEAQKIDKIMQTFAAEYFKKNKGLMENEDAAYVLSFAIMMLHTSLHNPSVKHKTSLEQWVTMNRGNNGGKDFPKQFLAEIFERIKKTQFATGQDHTTEIMEIQKQLVGSSIHNLANPQRTLILKVAVYELIDSTGHWLKRKQQKRILLVFNDLIIVAKKNKDQFLYKSSFSLFNTAVTQFSTEATQQNIQVFSILDKKILLQCSCETEQEHLLLLQSLHDAINMLNELEKARITGLVTTLDQTDRNNKHLSILVEDCDRLSSASKNDAQPKRNSTFYIDGVGDLERDPSSLSQVSM